TRWYEARLEKRFEAEIRERRAQLKAQVCPVIRPELRERFERLEAMRDQIAAQQVDDPPWFQEVLRKLDYLLEKYLHFASKDAEFRLYLASVLEEVGEDRRGARPEPAGTRAGGKKKLPDVVVYN